MTCPKDGCVGVIGALVCNTDSCDIFLETAHHRCNACGQRFLPSHGHPLFNVRGHGSLSVSFRIFAFRCCVDGVSLGAAVRLLGVSERTMAKLYLEAQNVMAWDALRRQSAIVFGQDDLYTVDVEVDEKSFKHWSDKGEEPALTTWHWLRRSNN